MSDQTFGCWLAVQGWLGGWSLGCLAGRLGDWLLIGWVAGSLVDRSVGWMTGWLVVCLLAWLHDWLAYWLDAWILP